jgi:hypothetical protein
MPITKFKDLIPILDVRNVDTALRFYVKIGLKMRKVWLTNQDSNSKAATSTSARCKVTPRAGPVD